MDKSIIILSYTLCTSDPIRKPSFIMKDTVA